MNRIPLPISFLTEQLQQNKPFSMSRWGDGELNAVFKQYGKNADGVKIDLGLSKRLTAVLRKKPTYYLGLLRIGLKYHSEAIEKQYSDLTWYNGDMLLSQFLEGKGKPLIEQLRQKRILYIGPNHCRNLNRDFFEYEHYIEIPGSTAHKTKPDILTAVRQHNIEVIGYSCGMASNLWIDELYDEIGNTVTQIDFGSLWDGFFGVNSRSYQKGIDFEKLLKDST